MEYDPVWLAIGFPGQALFSTRFLIQWIYSERMRKSVIPTAYFSIAGGATLLSCAIHKLDPVFIVGQAGGLIIYLRNLRLVMRERRRALDQS